MKEKFIKWSSFIGIMILKKPPMKFVFIISLFNRKSNMKISDNYFLLFIFVYFVLFSNMLSDFTFEYSFHLKFEYF